MTVALVAKASAEETAARMLELPHPAVAAFVAALGSEPSRERAKTAREAARLIHETDRVAARVAALAPVARDMFFFCSVGKERQPRSQVEERAWLLRGIRKEAARAALAELVALGLLAEAGTEFVAFPNSMAGCAMHAMAWLARAEPDAGDPIPVPFLLAVLASLVAEESPRLTTQGRPYARWLVKAHERMLHPACEPHLTDNLVALGEEFGLWRAEEDAEGRRYRPSAAGARAAFALSPDDFAMAASGRAPAWNEMSAYGWTLAERAFRRAGGDVADFSHVVAESKALESVDHRVKQGFVPWNGDVARIAESLGLAARQGRISIDRGRVLDKFRRAATPPADGKWTVLPNYEVLVPADAPPLAVFRLACIARLDRVDRVAKFVLDRTTVARRGAVEGLGASAVEILAERSAHPLPEAVAAAVAEWDVGVAPLKGFVGGVIVASSPAHAESLRADVDAPREIAPGVFFLSETRLQSVLDRARKSGIPVGAVDRRGRWDRSVDSLESAPLPDLARAATSFRKRFAAVVEARPNAPEKAESDASTKSRKAAPDTLIEHLGEAMGVGEPLLRKRWPHVLAALSGRPELIRRAARLPFDVMRTIGNSRSAEVIRSRVYEASLEWERSLRQGAESSEFNEGLAQLDGEDDSDEAPWLMDAKDFFGDDEDDDEDGDDDDILDEPPPVRSGRAAAKPLRLVRSAPTEEAPPAGAAWQVHPPGDLRRRLLDAAEGKATVEILYANAEGRKRERTVCPTGVRTAGGQDWLDATEPSAGGSRVSFLLDRIAALKG